MSQGRFLHRNQTSFLRAKNDRKPFEPNVFGAVSAEEKEIERLIVQQDTRIIVALRKGEEISLEAEKEALSLRGVLSDIRRRKRTLSKAPADSHLRSKQDLEKNRLRRNGI